MLMVVRFIMRMAVVIMAMTVVTVAVTVTTFGAVNFFVNVFFTAFSAFFVFIRITVGTFASGNLWHDFARVFHDLIVIVTLDHTNVLVASFILRVNADALAFNVSIVNNWWDIETSSVENTMDLILPQTITIVTSRCEVDHVIDSVVMVVISVVAISTDFAFFAIVTSFSV